MFDPAGKGKSSHGSLRISMKLEVAVPLLLYREVYHSWSASDSKSSISLYRKLMSCYAHLPPRAKQ